MIPKGEVRLTITVKTDKTQREVTDDVMAALDLKYGFQHVIWETPPNRQEKKCTVV